MTTGMSIAGRMSVFIRLAESTPKMPIRAQSTAMVYGRLRARRTIHMSFCFRGPGSRARWQSDNAKTARRKGREPGETSARTSAYGPRSAGRKLVPPAPSKLDGTADSAFPGPPHHQRRGRGVLRGDPYGFVDRDLLPGRSAHPDAGEQLAELHRAGRREAAQLVGSRR